MVTLYVAGQKVGTLADAERLFPELIARNQRVELRDDAGNPIATLNPTPARDPDWVAAITPEAIEQARAGPFLTLDEYRKQMGQQ